MLLPDFQIVKNCQIRTSQSPPLCKGRWHGASRDRGVDAATSCKLNRLWRNRTAADNPSVKNQKIFDSRLRAARSRLASPLHKGALGAVSAGRGDPCFS